MAALVERAGGSAELRRLMGRVPLLAGRNVRLRSLPQGISGATVFLADPTNLRGPVPIDEETGVLKVDDAPKLQDEAERYAEHVLPLLSNSTSFPILIEPPSLSRTRRRAAIFYRRVGELTLGERLHRLADAREAESIDRLFKNLFEVLRPWEERDHDARQELSAAGMYSFGPWPFETYDALADRLNTTYPDRKIAGYERTKTLWDPQVLEPIATKKAIGHGDLNTENVLVDRDGETVTLIDFASVGYGHFLRDAATLEAHLALRTLAPGPEAPRSEFDTYLDKLLALYTPERLFPDPKSLLEHTSEVEMVLRPIREHVWLSLMRQNEARVTEYVFAVLRHAVRIAVREDDALPDLARWLSVRLATHLTDLLAIERAQLRLRDHRIDSKRAEKLADLPANPLDEAIRSLATPGSPGIYAELEASSTEGLGAMAPRTSGDEQRRSSSLDEWYAHIPVQAGRDYESLDHVEVEGRKGQELWGRITRISPSHEEGFEWKFHGSSFAGGYFCIAFWPTDPSVDNTSRGVICLHPMALRDSWVPWTFGGFYYRPTAGHLVLTDDAFTKREYRWYERPPQTVLNKVALLDLDNTLKNDWSIISWVQFLADRGWEGAEECSSQISALLAQLASGEIDHDALARGCGTAYSAMLRGKREEEVVEAAEQFVRDADESMYEFVEPFVERLVRLCVAPIIVSGAPIEVVTQYAKKLGIEQYFALKLGIDDGVYTGRIDSNPGPKSGKEGVVKGIRQQERQIELAIGDSDSDRPLWDAARTKIVVGDLPVTSAWRARTKTLIIRDPVSANVEDILMWLNSNLKAS